MTRQDVACKTLAEYGYAAYQSLSMKTVCKTLAEYGCAAYQPLSMTEIQREMPRGIPMGDAKRVDGGRGCSGVATEGLFLPCEPRLKGRASDKPDQQRDTPALEMPTLIELGSHARRMRTNPRDHGASTAVCEGPLDKEQRRRTPELEELECSSRGTWRT